MCPMHYRRWYRRVGKSSGVTQIAPAMDRFMAHVHKTDGCWLWTGPRNQQGYGSFGVGRNSKQNAHRWLWEQMHGKASSKLHLDHLCRNRICVRPDHMELVTHAENLHRGHYANHNSVKTECKRGHPYDEANTYRTKMGRDCRACRRERARSARN